MTSSNDVISAEMLTEDNKTIDTRNITFQIWKNRRDPNFVIKFVELLTKFVDEKRVFDDIEFYLPQLVHMVIHLDVDFNNKALERFAVVISECSIHTSLQLSFILYAAMEDYQPEDSKGVKNPEANALLFFRCARLLQNVERAVVFGCPELSIEEEGTLAEHATKYLRTIERANRIVDSSIPTKVDGTTETMSGTLLYKRLERRGIFYSKGWKPRYIVLDQRVLFIYHDDDRASVPLRAFPLAGASIVTPENAKYPYYFELVNPSTNTKYQLRAIDRTQYEKWLAAIRKEIEEVPADIGPFNVNESSNGILLKETLQAHSDAINAREGDMTAIQRKKFVYFQQLNGFIKSLTDICERLR